MIYFLKKWFWSRFANPTAISFITIFLLNVLAKPFIRNIGISNAIYVHIIQIELYDKGHVTPVDHVMKKWASTALARLGYSVIEPDFDQNEPENDQN